MDRVKMKDLARRHEHVDVYVEQQSWGSDD